MILIVGVTGRLGRAVAERLLQDGIPFRAGCRNTAKGRWLSELGIEVFHLDLANGVGFAEAVRGTTCVISCVHGLLGKSRNSIEQIDVDGHASLINACVKASIQRFVYVSALGASFSHPSEFWRAKARTEQHLKASGMEYVILRPSAFMDLYAHDMIGSAVLRGKNVFLLGDRRTPRNLIAVADVADAGIKALLWDKLAGQTLEIGGTENPTEMEVVTMYAGLSGRTPRVLTIHPFALKILATIIAPFHAGVARILRLPLQLAGREDLQLHDALGTDLLDIQPLPLKDFVLNEVEIGKANS